MKKKAITEADKLKKRQVLLKSALELFYQHGFHATRLEDIAKQAGLSKGVIYLYFANKNAIFNTLIEELAVLNINKLNQQLELCPPPEVAIKSFYHLAEYLILETPLPKLIKVLISENQTFPESIEYYRKNVVDNVLKIFNAYFQQLQTKNIINTPNPEYLSKVLISPIIFNVIWQILFEPVITPTHRKQVQSMLKYQKEMFINFIQHQCVINEV